MKFTVVLEVGASVIAFALEEMAKCGADVDGIVEDVLLLGAPFTTDKPTWKLIRRVVAGRLVNVYSKNDWLLAFLYRAAEITSSVAGLAPIAVDSVENIDASLLVSDLSDYNRKLKEITEFTGFFDNNRRTSGIHS